MNADNCGKGLIVFSLTFISGVTVPSWFLPANQQMTVQKKTVCAKVQKSIQTYDERVICDTRILNMPGEIDENIYSVEKPKIK